MLKLLDFDQAYFQDEPVISILEVGRVTSKASGFTKKASDSRISEFVANLNPSPDKIYVHILAMGAGEFFGANRNADYFPEENLIKWFKTFETTPAHIFRHHINKDPTIAIGQVVHAIYNERMHRVEVIAWIDRIKGAAEVAKIEAGQFPSTSMACHTPFDTCSICGNKARSREEYCVHLQHELGRVYPDGRKTMAINDGPLKFFDMSIVFRPADVTSSVLQKLASARGGLVGSALQAEEFGIREKSASIKKVADLIKEVEGQLVDANSSYQVLLDKVQDPDQSVINFLLHYELGDIIHTLAELGISPSVEFFAKLIGSKLAGEDAKEVAPLVTGLIQSSGNSLEVPIEKVAALVDNGQVRSGAMSHLMPFIKSASLVPEMLLTQAATASKASPVNVNGVLYGPEERGYARGDGPEIRDMRSLYHSLFNSTPVESSKHGLLTTLVTVAGLAIAAKWLVTKMIEQKMNEVQSKHNTPAKIILVKTAGDAHATKQLAKASFLRSVNAL